MEKRVVFSMPGNEKIASTIAEKLGCDRGRAAVHHFPDGESFIRVESDVRDAEALIVCTLDRPDNKLLPLFFLSKTVKQLGARKTTLVVPYLSYMRQDRRFNPGEAVTSELFSSLISQFADKLITVDPHLHRRSNLSEIYTIETKVVHAAPLITDWIVENVKDPLLVGPDSESEQWVAKTAEKANAPFLILEKVRHGDRDVELSHLHLEKYKERRAVIVDDIISTGRTMIEVLLQLRNSPIQRPICIGIHAVFADYAYEDLFAAGAEKVITTNSVPHSSNGIDISDLLVEGIG